MALKTTMPPTATATIHLIELFDLVDATATSLSESVSRPMSSPVAPDVSDAEDEDICSSARDRVLCPLFD